MICMKRVRFSSRRSAKVRCQGPWGSGRAQPCTFWNLAEADNSNSYKTPHHKHWSTVWISERLHDCSTLLFWKVRVISNKNLTSWSSILDHLSWRLDPRVLRLDPCISKLKKFKLRDMRIESQVASFECQLTFQPYCISFLVVLTLIQYDNLSP